MSPKRRMKSAQGSLQPEFVAASVDHSGDEMDNRDHDLQFGNVEPGEVGMWPHCVCLAHKGLADILFFGYLFACMQSRLYLVRRFS